MLSHLYTRFVLINRKDTRGFSILEMIITIAIIGVITAIVVFRYGSFNNVVLLKNQALEIALDIREAQVIAVSAIGSEGVQFREDYGIYFDLNNDQIYRLYRDNGDGDPFYDVGEEVGSAYTLDSRFKINRLCVNFTSSEDCPYKVDDLSVTFKRPNFDATLLSNSGAEEGLPSISNARIEISSLATGDTRSVVVEQTGQINVQ